MNTKRSSASTGLIVIGAILGVVALLALVSGGGLLWAHTAKRDSHGYYATSPHTLQTPARALVSQSVLISRKFPRWALDSVELRTTSGKRVFVGIARQADVAAYLGGVERADLTSLDITPFEVTYRVAGGNRIPAPPAAQRIWAASVEGSGPQRLTWKLRAGRWAVVVMNADGSRGVAAGVSTGVRTSLVLPAGIGLAGGGALLAAFASGLIVVGGRRRAL